MMRRVFFITLFGLNYLSSQAQQNNPLINSGELIQQAIKLHDEGKYKDAIALYKQVTRNDTNYVYALYELALSLGSDSQYHESIKYCEEALSLSTEREREPDIYVQYGSMIDDIGESERALRIYDSGINKYPAYSLLYLNKGTTLMKMERLEEAEKIFQQVLLMDPYSASSHFRLGQVAMFQGKIVPAFISFVGYLMINPAGRYYSNAIANLSAIASGSEELSKILDKRKKEPSELIKNMEDIILSKIALDKGYKPLLKLDDPISRQIQVLCEKMEFSEKENDFWIQYYVPVLRTFLSEKSFEPFINYLFSNVNLEPIQNYNKKNKKEIQQIVNSLVEYFSEIRSTRELNFAKRKTISEKYLFEDGKLSGHGKRSANGELFVGNWEFYYPAGNIISKGLFNDKGEKEGNWNYYYVNGKLKSKEIHKNGKLNGEVEFFFSNGKPSSNLHYVNGTAQGLNKGYYYTGGPRFTEIYKDDKKTGEKKLYYDNGLVQTLETYSGDTLHGPYKSYYRSGQLEVAAEYVHGMISGLSKGYHENGKLSFECTYAKNNLEGLLKRYHDNGQLKSIENYLNGELNGEYIEYHSNGQLSTKQLYKKGKVSGEVSYLDDDGKLYSSIVFDDSKMRSVKYFDKTGKQISSSEIKSKKLEMTTYSPEGAKLSQRTYDDKGLLTGTLTSFYGSGSINETNEYSGGELNGSTIAYHPNGQKSAETSFTNGSRNGYYKNYYINGKVQSEGWYVDNAGEGLWLFYDEMGNLTSKQNYFNDKLHGYKEDYWPNGKKESETKYYSGWIEEYTQYDSTGKVINHVNIPNGNGVFTMKHLNGKLYGEVKVVNGNYEGPYQLYYFDGSPSIKQFYKRGVLDSIYRIFYYGGVINTEGQYKNGEKEGVWKYYQPDGTLSLREEYLSGKLNGKRTYYNPDGRIKSEADLKNGEKNGSSFTYDSEGKLVSEIRFKNSVPIGYTYNDKTGKPVPLIPIVHGNGKVKTYYENGNPAVDFEYKDGKVNGNDFAYHSNGKLWSESKEIFGITHGVSKEFYSNGKPKSEFGYHYDRLHGVYREYNNQGVLNEEGDQYNGSYHGTVKYFDNTGKLKETHYYYYGNLLSVKK